MSSAGRLIASCLAVVAAGLLMLGCGSGDEPTSADIDPQIASDLTGQLDRIEAFFEEKNCDRAIGAVDTLREAIDDVSDRTGEQFTADAQELTDNLATRVENQCVEAEETTSSTTDTTETDTVPTTEPTTTEPTTTETETTTTETTTKETTTSTPAPPTGPPGNPGGNPGGGNPGGGNPGGGINPGKRRAEGHGPKGSKDHGGGSAKKERSR